MTWKRWVIRYDGQCYGPEIVMGPPSMGAYGHIVNGGGDFVEIVRSDNLVIAEWRHPSGDPPSFFYRFHIYVKVSP